MADEKPRSVDPWRVALFVGMLVLVVWGIAIGRTKITHLNDAPPDGTEVGDGARVFHGVQCPIDVPADAPPIEARLLIQTSPNAEMSITRTGRARIADGMVVLAANGPGSGTLTLPDGRRGEVRWTATGCEPVTLSEAPPPVEDEPEGPPVEEPTPEPHE